MANKTLKQQIEEMRAGATKPSCFQDILDLQKKLDKILGPRQTRLRTLTDICLSAIAECIEFNEETKESHKTWKEKPFNELEMKKEAIDILFFFAQMLNSGGGPIIVTKFSREFNLEEELIEGINGLSDIYIRDVSRVVIMLINEFTYVCMDAVRIEQSLYNIVNIARELGILFNKLEMTYEEVLALYWDKWNENLDRIGEEWN